MGEAEASTRREFIEKGIVGAIAAATTITVVKATGSSLVGSARAQTIPPDAKYYHLFPDHTEMQKRYAMVIDLRRCIGCRACTVACKSENNVPEGVFRTWVKIVEKGQYPIVSHLFMPRLCNQCDNPPCVEVCPVKATYKRGDGLVLIDYDLCIGCGYCIQACPYDMRFLNPVRKTAEKCTFCVQRVDAGQPPACAATCVGRAINFGDLNDPTSEVYQLVQKNPVHTIKPELGTEPFVYYIGLDEGTEFRSAEVD